ncbi:MAG: NADP-specific glutamate dehydrogenase, partial [Oscillospiraceae bacterium]
MEFKSKYLQEVYHTVEKRNAGEPEFLQAIKEVLESFEPVVALKPEIEAKGIIERIVEPER